ncbi:hypothetical protein, partial [Arthrobacter sp. Leaf141]
MAINSEVSTPKPNELPADVNAAGSPIPPDPEDAGASAGLPDAEEHAQIMEELRSARTERAVADR